MNNYVNAEQLIFTRVNQSYSPDRKAGYQVVYRSEGVTPNDLGETQQAIECFIPVMKDGKASRLQFFRLSTDRVALAYTSVIPVHAEIIGARSGTFLTHCLIISETEFKLLGCDPFMILDKFSFIQDAETMLNAFGSNYTSIPPVEILLSEAKQPNYGVYWTTDDLRQLTYFMIGLTNSDQDTHEYPGHIVGEPIDILETIRLAFWILPPDIRQSLSFDTHVNRSCSIPTDKFRLLGSPQLQPGNYNFTCNLYESNQRWSSLASFDDHKPTWYLYWLYSQLDTNQSESVVQLAPHVMSITDAIQHRRQIQCDRPDNEQAIDSIYKAFGERIDGILQERIVETIGKRLSEVFIPLFLTKLSGCENLNIIADTRLALRYLKEWILEEPLSMDRAAWIELYRLGQKANDGLLAFVASTLAQHSRTSSDVPPRSISSEEYQRVLDLYLLRPTNPVHFVLMEHNRMLVAHPRLEDDLSGSQFLELAESLINSDPRTLVNLGWAIGRLDTKQLAKFERLISSNSKVKNVLAPKLEFRRTVVGNPETQFSRLKSIVPKNLRGAKRMFWRNNKTKTIICPHCLQPGRFEIDKGICTNGKCSSDSEPLPRVYVEDYEDYPPFFAPVIGWSQVGKTVYLQVLTLLLTRAIRLWRPSNYVPSPISEAALQLYKDVQVYEKTGELPPPTPLGQKAVYLMNLKNMPRWGGRTLVMKDLAGEIFEGGKIKTQYAPYILTTPTLFMMISLSEADRELHGLLMQSYIHTIRENRINLRREERNIVIVLSKADRLDLPTNLKRYLDDDPIWTMAKTPGTQSVMGEKDVYEYIQKMHNVSAEIENWLFDTVSVQDPTLPMLIQLAKSMGFNTKFSLISSLGSDPQVDPDTGTSRLSQQVEPRRVLDPFFWALEFQSEPG